MGRHYSEFVDDEALEDSELDSSAMNDDETGIKSDLDLLLGGGKGDRSSVMSDSTDDDDGSDLRDFIVQDDEYPSIIDHSIYRQETQPSLCERCRCRLGITSPSARQNSYPNSPISVSPSSVEVAISGSQSLSSDQEQKSIWNKVPPPTTTSPQSTTVGGFLSSSSSSVGNDPAPSYISLDDDDDGTEDEAKGETPSRGRHGVFSICRATSVYLHPVKKRKKIDSPPTVFIDGENRQTDRIPKKPSNRSREADTLFGDVPEEELLQAHEDPEEANYMASVGSDLHHADIKETLRDCTLGSSVLLIQDAWGGEAEIFPYREYVKAEERGDSDDVQAHYVKGPRDAQGKGDMFVLVRESIIDEMVPMKFGLTSKHIKVKVFNTKVSMIRARDVAKQLANSAAADPMNVQKSTKSIVSPEIVTPKRKRRREQWHSLKWRRLQNQVAAVREPWLRAARYGGAAYQWQR